MALSVQTLIPLLLGKSPSDRAAIRQQAEEVALGHTTSISSLNQSASFDMASAGAVLEAANRVDAILLANPAATAASVPAPSYGHALRRGSQILMAP